MLGLDISKATLACTCLDPQTRQVRWERTVPNSTAGVQQLLSACPTPMPWVLEPTGRYSLRVVEQATAAGRQVLLAPPKRAKAFLSALSPRAKTDRVDSRGLALYALAAPLRPYPQKKAVSEQIDQFLAARRLIAASVSSMRQQQRELPHAAAALEPAIAALSAQRRTIDQELAAQVARADGLPQAAALDAVPGIGPVTAAAVASCLVTKQFSHPDEFVAHVGLDVRVRDSGQRKGQRTLTRQGDAELRRLLYLCAQASLRVHDSPFRAQYEREQHKGLSTTAALCAVARKLAKVCWSLVRHGTTFDPARVYQQPKERL